MGDHKLSSRPHERNLKDQNALRKLKKSIRNDVKTGSERGSGRGGAPHMARKLKKTPKCHNWRASKASRGTPKTFLNGQRSSSEKRFAAKPFADDSQGTKRSSNLPAKDKTVRPKVCISLQTSLRNRNIAHACCMQVEMPKNGGRTRSHRHPNPLLGSPKVANMGTKVRA